MNRREFMGGVGAAASLAWGAGCASSGGDGSVPLRVLTYNVHHGEGGDGRLDLGRIAAVVRAVDPDLVALQEVDRRAQRTGTVDQPAEYQRLTGLQGWFGAAMPFQSGEYGQMLLSRWPLQEPRVIRLPGTRGREPRIAVAARVTVPGAGAITWVGCHLDAERADGDRWEQAGALHGALAGLSEPVLLAGDFNAVPESRVMARLLRPDAGEGWWDTAQGAAAPTIPAEAPRSRIDYILARPAALWRAESSRVLEEPVASDHRPVLAVLRGWARGV